MLELTPSYFAPVSWPIACACYCMPPPTSCISNCAPRRCSTLRCRKRNPRRSSPSCSRSPSRSGKASSASRCICPVLARSKIYYMCLPNGCSSPSPQASSTLPDLASSGQPRIDLPPLTFTTQPACHHPHLAWVGRVSLNVFRPPGKLPLRANSGRNPSS